jgi:hypothetical protein
MLLPGVTAPMASITFVRTTSFSIYQRSKKTYCDWLKTNVGVDVMGHVSAKGSLPNFWSLATFGAAGATAGSCITVVACEFRTFFTWLTVGALEKTSLPSLHTRTYIIVRRSLTIHRPI